MQVANNITILRNGELAATRKKEDTNVMELAEIMVGRKIDITDKSEQTNKQKLPQHDQTTANIQNFLPSGVVV